MVFQRLTLSLAAGSVLVLAACQAPAPGQDVSQTRNAAAIGAGVGALAGALTGDNPEERVRNAAIGAAVLGAAGAGVGTLLDRQEAELRSQLGSGTVTNTGSQLVVTLPQDILFGTDSASVSLQSQGDLRAVATSLNNYPATTVNVVGHTDSTGDAAYNQDLSERRASAVAAVLRGSGVNPGRINIVGRGEDAPIASNLTPEGRQQNRRVEIIITPNA
ncbi:OmpA family protein [Rubellimicrobium aerolatum]|uniref:OmpA family protein n=1 Tax=Rubellimicrobium aerolatum TaxID=490979 RepID=A0ABW0SG87_9RHOB|nr:OmpA family protein [Rubellimicrobium aerolatum]MBP1805826.1 outer membrane protein OmpA-like peptidoglycan-associated protein [Rubellimicrobium aerolatum]